MSTFTFILGLQVYPSQAFSSGENPVRHMDDIDMYIWILMVYLWRGVTAAACCLRIFSGVTLDCASRKSCLEIGYAAKVLEVQVF